MPGDVGDVNLRSNSHPTSILHWAEFPNGWFLWITSCFINQSHSCCKNNGGSCIKYNGGCFLWFQNISLKRIFNFPNKQRHPSKAGNSEHSKLYKMAPFWWGKQLVFFRRVNHVSARCFCLVMFLDSAPPCGSTRKFVIRLIFCFRALRGGGWRTEKNTRCNIKGQLVGGWTNPSEKY